MTSEERKNRRFSEDFRREQVRLIESGKCTIAQVSRLYEVKRDNVRRWLQNYGTKPLPKLTVINTEEDINRIKDLEHEVAELKRIIGQMHVEMVYKDELVYLAKEQLGADFEKKIKR